jgi:hypothetical protein
MAAPAPPLTPAQIRVRGHLTVACWILALALWVGALWLLWTPWRSFAVLAVGAGVVPAGLGGLRPAWAVLRDGLLIARRPATWAEPPPEA